MIDRADIMRNSRLAGQVRRYHTWPYHNPQSVAEHTYHILRIWHQLWGAIPTVVVTYAIYHDVGEMATGDLPYPIKKNWPELKEITTVIEEEYVQETLGLKLPLLDADQKLRFRICDLLEMTEFGAVEMLMGNRLAEPIVRDTWANILTLVQELSEEDKQKFEDFKSSNLLVKGALDDLRDI